jgi:hypothetical protein
MTTTTIISPSIIHLRPDLQTALRRELVYAESDLKTVGYSHSVKQLRPAFRTADLAERTHKVTMLATFIVEET